MTVQSFSERQRPVVIAAGGTGGHLFPGQALAEELRRRNHGVVLMTDRRTAALARDARHVFGTDGVFTIPSATFAGRKGAGFLVACGDILRGVWCAWRLIGRLRPAILVGFGGYPSLPPLLAAWARRLPFCLHEQNAVMGRVNRLMASRACGLATGFGAPAGMTPALQERLTVTGNPVRDAVRSLTAAAYQAPEGTDPFRLLIVGGSQGARLFDVVAPLACAVLSASLKARLRIVQQCRPENISRVRAAYMAAGIPATVESFFDDLPEEMAAAHLVIARAGAATVSELAVIGRPAILTPLAGALDDEQAANARHLADAGAAWVLPEASFTPDGLSVLLADLVAEPGRLEKAAAAAAGEGHPEAVRLLADLVETLSADPGRRPSPGRAHSGRPHGLLLFSATAFLQEFHGRKAL